MSWLPPHEFNPDVCLMKREHKVQVHSEKVHTDEKLDELERYLARIFTKID